MQKKLPGNVRERIGDLMRRMDVTQAALAREIECAESTFSRFMSEKTDSLSYESIIRLAEYFNVSTDYLLGVTDIPDRERYEIAELGLTMEAVKALCGGKIDKDVLNGLMGRKEFGVLTNEIGSWLNGSEEEQDAIREEIQASLTGMVEGVFPEEKPGFLQQIRMDIKRCFVPIEKQKQQMFARLFMEILSKMKRDMKAAAAGNIANRSVTTKDTMEEIIQSVMQESERDAKRRLLARKITQIVCAAIGAEIDLMGEMERALYEKFS